VFLNNPTTIIYNLISLRIFEHESMSVRTGGDEVNFEVDYGNLTVDSF